VGLGSDTHCNDTDGKNDIGALCRLLLKAHGVVGTLRAALFMSDDTCKSSDVRGRRVVLRPSGPTFQWDSYEAADSGCLQTLRCMLDD